MNNDREFIRITAQKDDYGIYYQIVYKDDNGIHIGYGSYFYEQVLEYKAEYFGGGAYAPD